MKYAKRIAIAFVACLITLACVELVYSEMHLNVYRGGGTSEGPVWSWIIYDPLMGWMNKPRYIKPNQFRIDKNGFRIIESSSSPDKNKRLIVCMGDSGTFGIWAAREDSKFGGLEFDSFPFYLQGILFGRNDKIINAGTIGYSSAHLLRQYVVSIRKLKPQIIVIRIGHNDHMPSWDKRLDMQQPKNAALRYLYRNYPSTLTAQTIAYYSYVFSLRSMDAPWSTLDQYESNLRTLIHIANSDGVRVLLVDYPLRSPVIPPTSKEGLMKQLSAMKMVSYEAYLAAHEKFMQRMEAVAQSTGTQIIRTRSRLEDPKEAAFSRFDVVHPNKHGMQIIAEEIAKVLLKDTGNQ